ncbi:DUF1553 domain-containing protein [Armatimonas sp.]|uniref:DUF1553 domain-containing protein n=1 Tax=Armatimonas sp. TaxID=1872638 RepID=UPI00374DD603
MTPQLPPTPPAIVRTQCLSCHGPAQASAGVRLDKPLTAALAKKVLAALAYNGAVKMPPSGKLTPMEAAPLTAWARAVKPEKPHWAWQALTPTSPLALSTSPPAPSPGRSFFAGKGGSDSDSPFPVRHERPGEGLGERFIDTYVLAKLQSKGLSFSPEADRRTLIRRLSFDLTGLPPSPAEIAAFVSDKRPDAYEKLVDKLLASPGYGERWGRKWLDLVHYGDTHGYDKDKRRDNAWPYRDWVIGALNADLPYSKFVQQQVAGDVLTPGDPAGIVATGFLVAGPWDFVGQAELREGTVDKEKTRVLDRDDIVTTTMATFNSVTVHCARCHDHKFDPIAQTDYYRLQAVFSGIERGDRIYGEGEQLTPGSPTNGYHSAIEKTAEVEKWVQVDLGKPQPLDTLRLLPARPTDFTDTPGFGFPVRFKIEVDGVVIDDKTGADFPNPGATPYELKLAGRVGRVVRITATKLWPRTGDFVFALAEAQVLSGGKSIGRTAKITALDSIQAGRWSTDFLNDGFDSRSGFGKLTYAALPHAPRMISLLNRGEVESPKEAVGPGALFGTAFPDTPDEGQRRAALAHWLTAKENALTWRSIVNRVWQGHFGRGIVETLSDFGKNGAAPTHPELLDALALWFRDSGQSLKKLHKLLVLSRAYKQSVAANPKAEKLDTDNHLLWRQNRRRLEAEEVRDSILATSGALDRRAGGPGFALFAFKDDHSPIYDHTDLAHITDPTTFRRTVYRFTVRSVPNPLLDCLDCADPSINTPIRNTTLTALQSLALLNDPFLIDQSERFAKRLAALPKDRQVAEAFRLALGRSPTLMERTDALAYVQKNGLENLCRLLFNTSEFVFVD